MTIPIEFYEPECSECDHLVCHHNKRGCTLTMTLLDGLPGLCLCTVRWVSHTLLPLLPTEAYMLPGGTPYDGVTPY